MHGKSFNNGFESILVQLINDCDDKNYKDNSRNVGCMLISLNIKQLNQFFISVNHIWMVTIKMIQIMILLHEPLIKKCHEMYPIAIDSVNIK